MSDSEKHDLKTEGSGKMRDILEGGQTKKEGNEEEAKNSTSSLDQGKGDVSPQGAEEKIHADSHQRHGNSYNLHDDSQTKSPGASESMFGDRDAVYGVADSAAWYENFTSGFSETSTITESFEIPTIVVSEHSTSTDSSTPPTTTDSSKPPTTAGSAFVSKKGLVRKVEDGNRRGF